MRINIHTFYMWHKQPYRHIMVHVSLSNVFTRKINFGISIFTPKLSKFIQIVSNLISISFNGASLYVKSKILYAQLNCMFY